MIIFSVAITVRGVAPQATKDDLEVFIECASIVPKTSIMGGKGVYFMLDLPPKKLVNIGWILFSKECGPPCPFHSPSPLAPASYRTFHT